MPDADAFRALARSSPWRWSTLRFAVRWPGNPWRPDTLRAWLRRPDLLRVETLDGRLLQVVREQRQQVGLLTTDGGRTVTLPWATEGPAAAYRSDGLVARRPDDVSYDAPMYQSYDWVAMLDPVELADGRDPDTGAPDLPGTEIDAVVEVEHGGRPAWEALVRTTPAYDPRCTCCTLLRSRHVDEAEAAAGVVDAVLAEYPQRYRVRLDVGTGVCVWIDDPERLTPGLDLRIEAVDEPMDDALFTEPRRGLFRRRGWQPGPPRPGRQ
ncbi:hypothetical protein ACI79D_12340 [Geodermatophilus sp. SYSU D00708]